ncbi:sodium/potassium/calcium exchanger 1 isoform X1 [Pleuronectes platessa]|uniref:sodium/potassium/calcium exchanger 1 isoform X1 n=1 Tax=Pleuronectes platessa TaxID=8262 RepID=UPI00232A6CCD|nr:sodium/potassium/calcium exchanger 1 isoform X1 [Pleuronectes platessa]
MKFGHFLKGSKDVKDRSAEVLESFTPCPACEETGFELIATLYRPQIGEDHSSAEAPVLEEPATATHESEPTDQTTSEVHVVKHLDTTTSDLKASTPTEFPPLTTTNRTFVHCIYLAPEPPPETLAPAPAPPEAPHIRGEYPADVFTIADRRRGWVVLHIFGVIYLFVSLAIVCDEFFVPALGVITDKLAISDDVAGATFMAAGRSAPKLFAYVVGVFIAHSNVGIRTIVGSAVFNILFVIGMSALFSRDVLHLTWWPLFRDVSFYILPLILLIIFFLDNVIMWWESMMLVASYCLYVIFLKFNVQLERAFKSQLHKHKNILKIRAVEEPDEVDMSAREGGSKDCDRNDEDEKDKNRDDSSENDEKEVTVKEEENEDKPLSLEWPDTLHKQASYLFLLPIVFPLWLTVPDVRRQKSRKFFVVTFLGSILWIAVFSYLMVWWAHRIGETIGVSHQTLIILASETSAPDLITSAIVARKGRGNMAVSGSLGSNIFDITVGLPVPWLLLSSIHSLAPVAVSSNGLLRAVTLLLLLMLLFVVIIASCKWRMNKMLGCIMLLLYFIFLLFNFMVQ